MPPSTSTTMAAFPPTPVMLYIGAGYDLSPLLTFAPDGPPYPITPLNAHPDADSPPAHARETYTSFLFVDAKPRHTSAFMVEDFDEWKGIDTRVRNIIHYAQGKLDRYRIVDAPPPPSPAHSPSSSTHTHTHIDPGGDLIWFEGGGDTAHITARRADPAWHFLTPPTSSSQPLTTLLYLFNTLDVELAPNPHLTAVWPRVEALYVHGLQLWPDTGLAPLMGGLRRCYVIVGSWGTPRPRKAKGKGGAPQRGGGGGVRNVDFVRAARRRWRGKAAGPAPSSLRIPSSTRTSLESSSSPLVFRHTRPRPSLSSGITTSLSGDTDIDTDTDEPWWDSAWEEPVACADRVRALAGAFASRPVADGIAPDTPGFSVPAPVPFPVTPAPAPFRVRIPQLAWRDSMNDGRGGYYVAKTVEESLAIWRARGGGGDEDSGSGGESDEHEEEEEREEVVCKCECGECRAGYSVKAQASGPTRRRRMMNFLRARGSANSSPKPRLRPRRPLTAPPLSLPTHIRSPSNSASDTEVSDTEPARVRRFWRVFSPSPSPPAKERISISDFLARSAPPSAQAFAFPYGHGRGRGQENARSASCPDLKQGLGAGRCKTGASGGVDRPARARTMSGLRFPISFGRKSAAPAPAPAPALARSSYSSAPRARARAHARSASNPIPHPHPHQADVHVPPVPPLPTHIPPKKSNASKPKPKARKQKRITATGGAEPFDWIGWLVREPRRWNEVPVGVDSDATRVGVY